MIFQVSDELLLEFTYIHIRNPGGLCQVLFEGKSCSNPFSFQDLLSLRKAFFHFYVDNGWFSHDIYGSLEGMKGRISK